MEINHLYYGRNLSVNVILNIYGSACISLVQYLHHHKNNAYINAHCGHY